MTKNSKTILTFSIPLLVLGVGYFAVMYWVTRDRLVGVTPEKPLRVEYTQSELPLAPFSPYWSGVAPLEVHLLPQNARVPYGTEERDIQVRGAYNDREIAFLIEFADSTENRELPTPDACAVFLGPEDSPPIAQMMGQDTTGNIWHWLANRDAEQYQHDSDSITAVLELVTSGPGTQTPLALQTVAGMGEYRDGRWHVVFRRSLDSPQDDALQLSPGTTWIISFAVWDGAKTEAFAAKSISIVKPLILDSAE